MGIKEAEKAIELILSGLEYETGSIVRSISVDDIDITKMNDDRRQIFRTVRIEMERLPGTNWA
jgi:hypothetical protein